MPAYEGPGALGVVGAIAGGVAGIGRDVMAQEKEQRDSRRLLFNELHDMATKATTSGQELTEPFIVALLQSLTGVRPSPEQVAEYKKTQMEAVTRFAGMQTGRINLLGAQTGLTGAKTEKTVEETKVVKPLADAKVKTAEAAAKSAGLKATPETPASKALRAELQTKQGLYKSIMERLAKEIPYFTSPKEQEKLNAAEKGMRMQADQARKRIKEIQNILKIPSAGEMSDAPTAPASTPAPGGLFPTGAKVADKFGF